MRKRYAVVWVLFAVAGAVLLLAATLPARSAGWQAKVDPWVLEQGASGESIEFLVMLAEQADLSQADVLTTKEQKGQFVVERLQQTAARTQPAVEAVLEAAGAEYRSYWVANVIWVRGPLSLAESLAQRADVTHLYANPVVAAKVPEAAQPWAGAPESVEWNIALVNAPALWAAGYRGQGVVIGGQDTGYEWTHPALQGKYRGWNGATADHNYNWHDAIHSGGGICGPDSPEPCDDYGHGTHTMGTMVGDDGGANQIGMAPDAKWIGCRNMNVGNGTPATYTECYQWFIAPTDLNGNNPDPSKAPHVINNSWGCPPSEGCTDPNVLLTIVQNVRAAGIVTVHSAGNAGSSCSSVNTPSAIYDESFSVGSTTSSDTISSFSSRGPVTVDGSNRLKPDISAPGSSIRSSVPGGGYGSSSGTSMAGPHVAGLVALLISVNPSLAGQVDQIETIIQDSAVQLTTTQECGGVPGNQIPNNTFGYGRIDALAAASTLAHTLILDKTAPATVTSGEQLTYTLNLEHQHLSDPTTNAVMTDVIPAGTTFVTATLPHQFDGTTVTWNFAQMAAGEAVEVALVVEVTATGGTIANADYGAQSDDAPFVTGLPVETSVVVPPAHALALQKSAPATVASGEWLTYTLSLEHIHPTEPTANVVLSDVLPVGTQFVTATLPHTFDGTTITWNWSSLEAGESVEVHLVVEVTAVSGNLVNDTYGALSTDVPFVAGAPVVTLVTTLPPEKSYLPLVLSGSSN